VHPAVAIWLWIKGSSSKIKDWNYKKDKNVLRRIVDEFKLNHIIPNDISIKNDDYLDAYIAWKLGKEWVENNNTVKILGNADTGSFLLPFDNDLFEKFKKYKI
jgi:hypothetical protein